MDIEKVIRNGKVAVIYSPGLGAGWYSWNKEFGERILFYPELVYMIEDRVSHWDIQDFCEQTFGEDIDVPMPLEIEWVPIGERFRIGEYDGSETVITEKDENWITA